MPDSLESLTLNVVRLMFGQTCLLLRQLITSSLHTRIELLAADHAIRVRIDQATHRASRLLDLLRQTLPLTRRFTGRRQPTLTLFSQQVRVAKKVAHIVPRGFVKLVRADLFVVADSLAAEAIRIRADATIVRPRRPAFRSRTADLLAIVRVAAARTGRADLISHTLTSILEKRGGTWSIVFEQATKSSAITAHSPGINAAKFHEVKSTLR